MRSPCFSRSRSASRSPDAIRLAARAAAGAARRRNTLRYPLTTDPTTLDPATVEDGTTIDMLQQVYEGLVKWDENNQIVPNIAEKWDVSKDGTVFTFHLKTA